MTFKLGMGCVVLGVLAAAAACSSSDDGGGAPAGTGGADAGTGGASSGGASSGGASSGGSSGSGGASSGGASSGGASSGGSSGSGGGTGDGGPDSGSGGDDGGGPDAGTGGTTGTGGSTASGCGGGNSTNQRLGQFVLAATGLPQPSPAVPDAEVTIQPTCTGVEHPPTDSGGFWDSKVVTDAGNLRLLPPETPLWLRFAKTGFVPLNTVEFKLPTGMSGTFHDKYLGLVATAEQGTVFPNWSASKAAVIVEADLSLCQAGAATAALTVVLDGHPEAKVTYWGTTAPDPTATSMGLQSPRLVIDDITPGDPATLTVQDVSDGGTCTPSVVPAFANRFATGRVPLVAGEVTHVILGAL